jgi:hypothetical protein
VPTNGPFLKLLADAGFEQPHLWGPGHRPYGKESAIVFELGQLQKKYDQNWAELEAVLKLYESRNGHNNGNATSTAAGTEMPPATRDESHV